MNTRLSAAGGAGGKSDERGEGGVYGRVNAVSIRNLNTATAAFDRSTISIWSPYDRSRYGEEPNAISAAARPEQIVFASSEKVGVSGAIAVGISLGRFDMREVRLGVRHSIIWGFMMPIWCRIRSYAGLLGSYQKLGSFGRGRCGTLR